MRHLWEFSEPLICSQTLTKREKSKRRESSTETEYGAHLKWIHSKHPLLLKQLKDLYCREQSWNKHVQLGAQDFPPTAVWEEGRHCLGHVVFAFPLFPYQRQIREPEKRIISSMGETIWRGCWRFHLGCACSVPWLAESPLSCERNLHEPGQKGPGQFALLHTS